LRPPIGFDERSVARLRQELRVDEGAEQFVADGALETPQALRLRGRQSKSGHLTEFALDSLKHVVYTHGSLRPMARSLVASSRLESNDRTAPQELARHSRKEG
jgi:hypothetical protein